MSAWAHCLGSSFGETGSQCQRRALGGLIRPEPPISCSISRGLTPPSACHAHTYSAGLTVLLPQCKQQQRQAQKAQRTRRAINMLVVIMRAPLSTFAQCDICAFADLRMYKAQENRVS